MKIIFLIVLYFGLLINGAHASPERDMAAVGLPMYVKQFVAKAGIPIDRVNQNKPLQSAIPEAAKSVGLETVRSAAASATDGPGGPYFRIETYGKFIVIERHYPLIDDIRELRLYIERDEGGGFKNVSFSEGVIR